ncbi:hypothetical protein [Proteiniborus sp.]|uniref:DUF6115 domain-containing protein n=1 Tax=Proteiniborus sp. TaxID=2079015 RepID=UPI00331E04A5
MNTIILIFGLFLVVISVITILLNNKSKNNNIGEYKLAYDHSKDNSLFTNNGSEFEEILDNINTYSNKNDDAINDEKKGLDSENLNLDKICVNYSKDSYVTNFKEEISEDSQNSISKRIVELSNSGLRAEQIAKILGKGIREIEIILKFQHKKSN